MTGPLPGHWQRLRAPPTRLLRPILACLGLAAAAACTRLVGNGAPATASAEAPHTTNPATPVASQTTRPFLTPGTSTATVTDLPYHVYEVDMEPWPEEGDLLDPAGDRPEFGVEIGGLPSGEYLLLAESDTKSASIYSLETGETAVLLRPDSADSRPEQYILNQRTSLLGSREPAGNWRLYDLRARSSWIIGPTCRGAWSDWLSPDGDWIGTVCSDDHQLDGVSYTHTVIQFLSTRSGTGVRFAIPSIESERDKPDLAWIDDGRPLISRVLVGGELRACILSVEQATMYCPPLGLGAAAAPAGSISPAEGWVPFERSEFLAETTLVPPACFEAERACEETLQLSESAANVAIPTADPGLVWWIELLGPDPTTEAGLVDLSSGEFTQVVSLGGDYSPRAVCPGGDCIFVFELGSGLNWRLSLDGSLQVMPFRGDVIIGSFTTP